MKLCLGVTDNSWYNYLSNINPDDINFWQPGGNTNFRVLDKLEPFLFKLKSPNNVIGGVGFFSTQTFLPMNMAWEVFGTKNGCNTFNEFQNLILQYRNDKMNLNATIGCIVLTNPIFFRREDWIEVPFDWSRNIVQGKSYDTNTFIAQEPERNYCICHFMKKKNLHLNLFDGIMKISSKDELQLPERNKKTKVRLMLVYIL